MLMAELGVGVGMQQGDDRDPFAEAEEQEVLRERDAKRRNVAMLRQMAPSQVCSRGLPAIRTLLWPCMMLGPVCHAHHCCACVKVCGCDLWSLYGQFTWLHIPTLWLIDAVLLHRHQQQEVFWHWAPHSLPARKQLSRGRASLEALAQPQPPPLHHQGPH